MNDTERITICDSLESHTNYIVHSRRRVQDVNLSRYGKEIYGKESQLRTLKMIW